MEISTKVRNELVSMSSISYPHGEPPLELMDNLVFNNDWDFLEDELLDIIYHSNE